MQSLFKFLRATIAGGILFLLPLVILIILLIKAYHIVTKISEPLARQLPEIGFGLDGSALLAILILILVSFLSGLIFLSPRAKQLMTKLEDGLLIYIPGYFLMKSVAADVMGEKIDNKMTPVLVQDGENWNIGFLIESFEQHCTVFLPDAPRHDAGEVKIVPLTTIKKIDIPINKVTQSLKSYGKGALHWNETPRT